ncbi:hypothetical protein [Tateyamaria sp. Alg231-49]|uniref:hypothetical protein n=1 Tax=Tateyamaria sp. Alg231-49 TaxID=1922219 RepID=UPI000D5565F4|nr:hypothetical protein [Tateyamaria sp. Alg231-49]
MCGGNYFNARIRDALLDEEVFYLLREGQPQSKHPDFQHGLQTGNWMKEKGRRLAGIQRFLAKRPKLFLPN